MSLYPPKVSSVRILLSISIKNVAKYVIFLSFMSILSLNIKKKKNNNNNNNNNKKIKRKQDQKVKVL